MSVEALKGRPRRLAEWRDAAAAAPRVLPLQVVYFLISLFVAFQFSLGPVKLSTSRTLLLLLLVPLVVKLLRGAAGRMIVTDVAMILFCAWVFLSMYANHGLAEAVEFSGINAIETLGAYLLARCMIRDAESFAAMVKVMFGIILFLTPFALLETITGYNLLLHLTNAILRSQPEVPPLRRMGLERVQATLDHPIHFGVCIGAFVGLTYKVLGYGAPASLRYGRPALVALVAFLSVSTSALLGIVAQCLLLAWGGLTRAIRERWRLLAGILLGLAVFELATGFFLDMLISQLAYNPKTAFNRTRIFGYALANIQGSPLFGIGLHEWTNIPGMSDSIDMFWMLVMLRHGAPAGILLLLAYLWLPLALMHRDIRDPRVRAYREGYIVTLTGLFLVMWAVHVWREAYALILFLLGSGSWMLEIGTPKGKAEEGAGRLRFTKSGLAR